MDAEIRCMGFNQLFGSLLRRKLADRYAVTAIGIFPTFNFSLH